MWTALGAAIGSLIVWAFSHIGLAAELVVLVKRRELTIEKIRNLTGIEDVVAAMNEFVVDYARQQTGIELSPDAPLSDASIAGALTQKTGFPIRSVLDRSMMKEDFLSFAMLELEAKTGIHLSDVTDREAVKKDVASYASGVFSAKMGIPLTDISNIDQTREELQEWAKAYALAAVSDDVKKSADLVMASGVDTLGMLQLAAAKAGIDPNTGRTVLVKGLSGNKLAWTIANSALAQKLADIHARVAKITKRTRRQEQLRIAQRDFRKRHGNRMQYRPLSTKTAA